MDERFRALPVWAETFASEADVLVRCPRCAARAAIAFQVPRRRLSHGSCELLCANGMYLTHRLPRWLMGAKNRDDVVRLLDRMRAGVR